MQCHLSACVQGRFRRGAYQENERRWTWAEYGLEHRLSPTGFPQREPRGPISTDYRRLVFPCVHPECRLPPISTDQFSRMRPASRILSEARE